MEEKEYMKNFDIVPIYKEIYSDLYTPVGVLNVLRNNSKDYFLLESLKDEKNWGRYSFLGYNPTLKISGKDNIVKIKEANIEKVVETLDPKKIIEEILNNYKSPRIKELPTFTGGFVGYFSYDYYKYIESDLNITSVDKYDELDFNLMLYEKIIAFDNFKKKIYVIVNVKTNNFEENRKKAILEIDKIIKLIKENKQKDIEDIKLETNFKYDMEKTEFLNSVDKIKNYVKNDEVSQVVLSNGSSAKAKGSILNVYRVLQTTNPSPYMIYFNMDDLELAASSPETLIKLENNILRTFPLAGTRKRGLTKKEDEEIERELLEDEKELSEHNMLIEVGKIDLEKVSKKSSISVEKLRGIERFSEVMHIGSTIVSEKEESFTQLDVLDAIFPAGTLSGYPKLRACQVIDELETRRRGIYGGAIGYIDFTGNLDMCIGIRMIYKKDDDLVIQSGAGIVENSIPENEYEECMKKSKAIRNSLDIALNGIE